MIRRTLQLTALCAAIAMLAAPAALGDYGIAKFTGETKLENGEASTQAAARPFSGTTTIATNEGFDPEFEVEFPEGNVKGFHVESPPGLIGNTTVLPRCPEARLLTAPPEGLGYGNCPAETQIGLARLRMAAEAEFVDIPMYNMVPRPGIPASFAFNVAGSLIHLDAELRSEGDYGLTINVENIPQSIPLIENEIIFWGTPSAAAHDPLRLCDNGKERGCGVEPSEAFLTNPANCSVGPMTTGLATDSWQQPGFFHRATYNADVNGVPTAFDGCAGVPFEPSMRVRPTTKAAASPTGLEVDLEMPYSGDPAELAQASLKKAVVQLPEGMTVNPSSASGLEACSTAQMGLMGTDFPAPRPVRFANGPVNCPSSSKIGTARIDTPALDDPLLGAVYLAEQKSNPFGSLLALYLVAENVPRGVSIKLPGRVDSDPQTGRLVATFDNNPQQPFTKLHVELFGGQRASLMTPPTCGTHTSVARMSSWSATDPDNPPASEIITSPSSFEISGGPNGQPCPNGSFNPKLSAGTQSPFAGAYSPFTLRLTREDGDLALNGLTATLPPGLIGKLAGISYCPDAALAGIPTAEGTGAAQFAAPSCPSASLVGNVTVGAGAGANPFYVQTGRAYLGGPYKGAPLSLAIVTPALAGPFDLGNVVVRTALQVNPESAQITAVSDPIPTIVAGIPLSLRDIRVDLGRPGFTLNPTSCDPMAVAARVSAAGGGAADLSDRFQVGNCSALRFKPQLALRLKGGTKRTDYPALTATLRAKPGEANIGRTSVALPRSEFLAQEHIRTICTRVQFAADACPKRSIYGQAVATTPLLDQPLRGPVYLRSSSNKLPDLVAALDGQIEIDLVGRIDSVRGGIRTTFETVPDAPVSKFVLKMQGGKKGLLVNSRDVCKSTHRATVRMDGQNGKVNDFLLNLRHSGCKKKSKG